MFKKLLSLNLFLVCSSWAYSQKESNLFPTYNKEITVSIGKDSIATYALIAEGEERKETVILLHGLPGYDNSFDLAQYLRSKGKNIVFIHFRGSWGSQGIYSYSNCIEDIHSVIEHYSAPELSKKLHIDTASFILIGHSLGGGQALIVGANNRRVKKVVALSALNLGYRLKRFPAADSLVVFQKHLDGLFMLNCNSREFIGEAFDNREEYDVLSHSDKLSKKEVLIIDDFDRSEQWPGQLKSQVDYKLIESDHSFTNKRKEMIKYVNKWIDTH